MAIEVTRSALMRYEEECRASKPKPLLKRSVCPQGEILTIVERDQLGLIDRIRLFLGLPSSDFKLATIRRVAQEALSGPPILPADRRLISRTIRVLNTSIFHHNDPSRHTFSSSWIQDLFLPRPSLPSEEEPPQQPEAAEPVPTEEAPVRKRRARRPRAGKTQKASQTQRGGPLPEGDRIREASQIQRGSPLPDAGRIRGIVNPGSLCYSNASFVALCASPAFRRKVLELKAQRSFGAELLHNVFADMRDLPLLDEPLSRNFLETPLELLHETLCNLPELNFLRYYWTQQDAQEFMTPLLDYVLEGEKFTLVRQKNEVDPESRDPRLRNVHVPTVDTQGQADNENMVFVEIPKGIDSYNIQNYFNGTVREEEIDVDALLEHRDAGRTRLSEEERSDLLQGEPFAPIATETSYCLQKPIPSVLPVYLPRFLDFRETGGQKNTTPVTAPFRLTVPVEGAGPAQYELKSVIVHHGQTKQSGHYCTYIPDPASNRHGHPTRWVLASDASPKEVLSWEEVQADITKNGVLFMYDIVPQ